MVAWNYDGATNLDIVATGLGPSEWYWIVGKDADSSRFTVQADGSGAFSTSLTGIGDPSGVDGDTGAGIEVFSVEVRHVNGGDPGDPGFDLIDYAACNIFSFGTPSVEGSPLNAVWSYDGAQTFSIDYPSDAALEYKLEVDFHAGGGGGAWNGEETTGWQAGSGGTDMLSKTVSGSPDAIQGYIVLRVRKPGSAFPGSEFQFGNRMFIGGSTDLILGNPLIPTPPPPAPEGMVGVAFDNATLDEDPTYTWLDQVDGVSVERVDIKRGRPDEHEKTAEGTATITGKDRTGALDPTNPFSPFYAAGDTKLNPALQARVQLQHPISEAWSPIITGYVDDWDYDLDVSEKFFTWTLTLTDALGILADAEVIPDQAGNTVPGESVGDVAYDPAFGDDRVKAALADAALSAGALEWPASLMSVFSLNVKVRGKIYSTGSPLLTVIDDACDAEFPGVANRYASRFGVFTVHGRLARFDPTNPDYGINTWKLGDRAAFIADDTVAIISGLKFNRGKDNLINAVLPTPEGIKDADIAGQFVKDATSIAKYSARSRSFPNLITLQGHDAFNVYNVSANDETKKVGEYYVDNYKTPRTRVRQVVFRPQNPDTPEGGPVWDVMCGVELSDLVSPLKTTHPGGGGFNEDFFVEGIAYQIVPMTRRHPDVTLTLDVSPRAYFDVNPYS